MTALDGVVFLLEMDKTRCSTTIALWPAWATILRMSLAT